MPTKKRSHSCIQGDSFRYDISIDEFPVLDTYWEGSWAIVKKLDDKVDGDDIETLVFGDLIKSADSKKFEIHIFPNMTDALPVASYLLISELTNTSLGYNKEVMQDKFAITKQGI